MCYIPDALDMFHRHDAEQEAELQKLPKCSECGEPIQDEYCYEFDGKYICEHCLKEHYRVSVENLI